LLIGNKTATLLGISVLLTAFHGHNKQRIINRNSSPGISPVRQERQQLAVSPKGYLDFSFTALTKLVTMCQLVSLKHV
jgi:hypothetical protein